MSEERHGGIWRRHKIDDSSSLFFLSFFLFKNWNQTGIDGCSVLFHVWRRRESENGGFFLERRRRRIETPPPIRVGSLSLFCFLGCGLRSYSFSIRTNARGEDSPPLFFLRFGAIMPGTPTSPPSIVATGVLGNGLRRREARVPSSVIATATPFISLFFSVSSAFHSLSRPDS